jgi:hypothetical protein
VIQTLLEHLEEHVSLRKDRHAHMHAHTQIILRQHDEGYASYLEPEVISWGAWGSSETKKYLCYTDEEAFSKSREREGSSSCTRHKEMEECRA